MNNIPIIAAINANIQANRKNKNMGGKPPMWFIVIWIVIFVIITIIYFQNN